MRGRHPASAALALALSATGAGADSFPPALEATRFSGPDVTPCPACLCAAPTGEVFVGVDLLGSLGKGPGKGRVVRLVDADGDGEADAHTVFAEVDNPRGLAVAGETLLVLHTVIPADTGELTGMHLSAFTDADGDGVADGPPERLVSDLSPPEHNRARGADHTTNGIRIGIDGWVYIAVGDFGIAGAEGSDGTRLTMLGGGIVRVRPDGSELEVYTHGMRNIYDVAIDPFLNIFTRGNTNDGGGWNVRFTHHVQSARYGYPTLFKNFTDEVLPALVDLGGGSGTGALFLDEPAWPDEFNKVPLMCDWGKSVVAVHRVEPDGATFTQEEEPFVRVSQVTDLDVDASGQMFVGAWDGAGYQGNPGKGYVVRLVPKGWRHRRFPDLARASDAALVSELRSGGATARLAAQQAMLARPSRELANQVARVALDQTAGSAARVAAVFTYKQLLGTDANPGLLKLSEDPAVREFALRALADRLPQNDGLDPAPFVAALGDRDPRVRVAAAVALGRIGAASAAPALLAAATPPDGWSPPAGGDEGPHATPDSSLVVPHVAVRAVVEIDAVQECLEALSGPSARAALWALRSMHSEDAVEGLISAYHGNQEPGFRRAVMATLARLQQVEAPYDGSWWWGTRPDTRGPFYRPADWAGSAKIADFIKAEWEQASPAGREEIAAVAVRHRLEIDGVSERQDRRRRRPRREEPEVDLTAIAGMDGQIGKMSIEDVILGITEVRGDASRGQELFTRQGCIACHTTEQSQPLKGPYMGHVGSILSRDQIAESILKPDASISQGFATVLVTKNDGGVVTGFVTSETADEIELRDIAGQSHRVAATDVAARQELPNSMMPPGLANALSLEDFASLVSYLEGLKD